jgi:DNA-binding CsgD family transcriptional regulator
MTASTPVIERTHRDLLEVALEAATQAEFRRAWCTLLRPIVGFDAAAVLSTSDGVNYRTHVVGADEPLLQLNGASYMAEVSSDELRRAMSGHATTPDSVFTQRRREKLGMFREYLRGERLGDYASRAWLHRGTFTIFALGRSVGSTSFSAQALSAIDHLFAAIALGERVQECFVARDGWKRFAQDRGITQAEMSVAQLAQRGLTTKEIASVVGSNRLTVRNQLGAVYRKANVTNRTELAFLMSTIENEHGSANSAVGRLIRERQS